jgi:ABC-type nitrate/sulfonate/bicarbonate transport system substrate-binding protein
MSRRGEIRLALASLAILTGLVFTPTARAETVTIGLVGTASATHWPIYIGLKQGFYAAKGIDLDLVFTPSSAALLQQLSAGSLPMALSAGIVDPIYAIDKGAGIAIVRLEMQSPPYALIAKSTISSIAELKGKTLMVDGPKGITKIYVERMLAANGVKPGEFDTIFAGATAARFSALQAGAIDATVLLPPFNFYAETAGFKTVGLTIDYTPELPFTAAVVNRNWAASHRSALDKMLAVHNESMAWFLSGAHRAESIAAMVEASKQSADDVGKAYDFLTKRNFFEASGKVSKTRMNAMLGALRELGDISSTIDVDRLLLPGVTQVTD